MRLVHKPTSPFPYNTVVNLGDYPDELAFSASVYNSSPITSARLKINVANTPYYFSQETTAYTITWSGFYHADNGGLPKNFYLWDSWFRNWIAFSPVTSIKYSWESFIYDSKTDTVECIGRRSAEGIDEKYPVLARYSTVSSSAIKFNQSTPLHTTKYEQTLNLDENQNTIPLLQSQSNGHNKILLQCDKEEPYIYKTNLTSQGEDLSIPIYGDDSALLQPNSDYSWQVRLYENVDENHLPNNCLGYGFVVESRNDGRLLKIRPHTNIDYNTTSLSDNNKYYQFSFGGQSLPDKYYISINGKVRQISEFWNSDTSREIKADGSNSAFTTPKEMDSYGDALYGWAYIEWGDGDAPTIDVGTQYAIFCNYADSDEFYFSTTNNCKLTLSDSGHTDDKHIDDEGKPIIVTDIDEDIPIYVHRSDFLLSGEYEHLYGAIASRYRVLLYKVENDTETLVDDTDYIQDSYILYSYNQLISGEKYRLFIEVIDTNDYSIQKSVDINVRYKDSVTPVPNRMVRIDSYPQHNSVIIDWSNMLGDFPDINDETGDNDKTFLGFDVYKTIGENDKLYQVASRNTTGIVEDFLVGDRVKYVYYIYPVYLTQSGEQIQTPIISESITLSHGRMKLVGLNLLDDDNNIYTIDTDNLWVFGFDLSDNGATVVNSKTFTDTLSRYSKETVGSTQYVTKQVSGLLGKIDCSDENADYLDTYDNIVDWRNFVSGSQLKAFVDLRGVIYICDTEANPTDNYNENLDYATSVTFTIHEIDSLDYISVFARDLEYNPRSFMLLADRYDVLLRDNEPLYLATDKESAT